MTHILLRNRDIPDIWQFDTYVANGGYDGLKKAVQEYTPDDVIRIVIDSNLRGRGGAGFPAGRKWSFIPKDAEKKYVTVNADESEPGTFKDRELLEKNPHQVIEGVMIAAYAIQATAVYIYCRGEFWDLAHALEERDRRGAESKSGWAIMSWARVGAARSTCTWERGRISAARKARCSTACKGCSASRACVHRFPAQMGGGLYYWPTVVNNVETLSNVPWIIVNGADAYKAIGTPQSPGPKIFCMSGHIAKPGNYELPLGMTFRELIYDHAGGIPNGKKLKAILPSGASGPVLRATDDVLDAPLTYESLAELGSTLGSASVILMDEDTDMVWAAAKMIHFLQARKLR